MAWTAASSTVCSTMECPVWFKTWSTVWSTNGVHNMVYSMVYSMLYSMLYNGAYSIVYSVKGSDVSLLVRILPVIGRLNSHGEQSLVSKFFFFYHHSLRASDPTFSSVSHFE